MADKVDEKTLQQTSTWAVAVVCFFLLLFSIVIEKLIHKLGTVSPFFTSSCICLVFLILCFTNSVSLSVFSFLDSLFLCLFSSS